jgi:hypothetical protein
MPFSQASGPKVVSVGSGRGERQARNVPSSWTFEKKNLKRKKVYQILMAQFKHIFMKHIFYLEYSRAIRKNILKRPRHKFVSRLASYTPPKEPGGAHGSQNQQNVHTVSKVFVRSGTQLIAIFVFQFVSSWCHVIINAKVRYASFKAFLLVSNFNNFAQYSVT